MALSTGSIAFTGFNADGDGDDALAFVVLTEIAAGQEISFTLGGWYGSAFSGDAATITWTAPSDSPVAAGTVIVLSALDSTPSANIGEVTSASDFNGDPATFELDPISIVFAYEGTQNVAPSNFLTAMSAWPFGWNYGSTDGLDGTGLTQSVTAFRIPGGDTEIATYDGPRVFSGDIVADTTRIYSGSHWARESDTGAAGESSNGTAPDLPFDAGAFGLPTLSIGDGNDARESEGPSGGINFTLRLDVALSTQLTVHWEATGTGLYPVSEDDFEVWPQQGIAVFEPGETFVTISLEVFDDDDLEFNETVSVRIVSDHPELNVAADPIVLTIRDDDGTGDAPTPQDDTLVTPPDTPLVIDVQGDLLVNDTDPNGDFISIDELTHPFVGPDHGTLAVNGDGTLTYTPEDGFIGIDSFTYTIVDADGNAASATVQINVVAAADPYTADFSDNPGALTFDFDGFGGSPDTPATQVSVFLNESSPGGVTVTGGFGDVISFLSFADATGIEAADVSRIIGTDGDDFFEIAVDRALRIDGGAGSDIFRIDFAGTQIDVHGGPDSGQIDFSANRLGGYTTGVVIDASVQGRIEAGLSIGTLQGALSYTDAALTLFGNRVQRHHHRRRAKNPFGEWRGRQRHAVRRRQRGRLQWRARR